MSILSIELTPELDAHLEAVAASRGATKADVAKRMIETSLAAEPKPPEAETESPFVSAYERMKDLCGILDGPGDLS